jgi:hypothetical protein
VKGGAMRIHVVGSCDLRGGSASDTVDYRFVGEHDSADHGSPGLAEARALRR